MGRFFGYIGFLITEETSPGVWTEQLTERPYYGDVLRNRFEWSSSEHLNDNVLLNNNFSIVADTYARQNIGAMKYVKWSGTCWKIAAIEEEYPRLKLMIGGLYNGEQAEESD